MAGIDAKPPLRPKWKARFPLWNCAAKLGQRRKLTVLTEHFYCLASEGEPR